jgi:hypothetical protein
MAPPLISLMCVIVRSMLPFSAGLLVGIERRGIGVKVR